MTGLNFNRFNYEKKFFQSRSFLRRVKSDFRHMVSFKEENIHAATF